MDAIAHPMDASSTTRHRPLALRLLTGGGWCVVALLAVLVTVFQDTPLLNRSLLATTTTLDPARMMQDGAHAFTQRGWWFGWGDSTGQRRSAVRLFEDGVEMPLSHASHDDIRDVGGGRWSHWTRWLILSSTDGTDPRTNGRRYTVEGLTLPVRLGAPLLALVALVMSWRSLRQLLRESAASSATRRPPRRSVLIAGSLVVTLLLVVLSLAVLEGILRLRAPAPGDGQLALATGLGWRRAGEPYRRIGSSRDDDGACRVLFVGDSFTHGRTWCDRTMAQLRARGINAIGFEAGVSGFGTTQELLQLQLLIPEVRPDVIVLQVYAWNDPRDNWPFPGLTYNPRMTLRPYLDEGNALTEPSSFAIGIRSLELWKQLAEPTLDRMHRVHAMSRLEQAGLDVLAEQREPIRLDYSLVEAWAPFYQRSRQSGAFVDGAWRATERSLEAIRNLCTAAKIPLLVIALDAPFTVDAAAAERSVPAHLRISPDWNFDLPMRQLTERAKKLQLNFIDVVPALRARRDALSGASQFDGADVGAHLLPETEETLADLVAPWIEGAVKPNQRRR